MQTQTIIDGLASVPIGTIVAWVTIVAGILAGVSAITVKLYKVFSKYKEKADEYEGLKSDLRAHAETLDKMSKILVKIQGEMQEQVEVNRNQVKHSIVVACDKALSEGRISAGALESLMDLFEEYTDVFHGNGYVKALVDKVLRLPVTGRLE